MHITVTRKVLGARSLQAVRRLCASAEQVLRLPKHSAVSVFFVSDREMRALNKKSRGISHATDVLSFPLHARRPYRPAPDGQVHLGDIVISVPTARTQARERKASLAEELDELFVHGLLHLVGYDHARKREAARMAHTAEAVLRKAGA